MTNALSDQARVFLSEDQVEVVSRLYQLAF
jgi:hypothetical protein